MSKVVQYYCDICEKEIPKNDVTKLHIKNIVSLDYNELEICKECHREATKCLYSDAKDYEKKRLGSILKLLFRRKKVDLIESW